MKLKSYAVETHQGPYLQNNEDGYLVDIKEGLFIVLDGFGGVGIGDRVVEELKQDIQNFYKKFSGDPDSTLPFYFSSKYLLEGNALVNAMKYAHKKLIDKQEELEMQKKGGSSAVIGCLCDGLLILANVGNCQSYLLRKGHLIKIYNEDSALLLGKDEHSKSFRTTPTNAFGLFQDLHFQIQEVKILKGDKFVFFTDGVYARLDEDEIKDSLMKQNEDLSDSIQELFGLANTRGNLDNQTTLLLNF